MANEQSAPVLCEYSAAREVRTIVVIAMNQPAHLEPSRPLRDASGHGLAASPARLPAPAGLGAGFTGSSRRSSATCSRRTGFSAPRTLPDGCASPTTSAAAWP